MSLIEEAREHQRPQRRACAMDGPVAKWGWDEVRALLADPSLDPRTITRFLDSHGFSMDPHTVSRHKRGDCRRCASR